MHEESVRLPSGVTPHVCCNSLLAHRDLAPLHFVVRLNSACTRAAAVIGSSEETGRELDSLSREEVSTQCKADAQKTQFQALDLLPELTVLDHGRASGVLGR